MNLQNVDRSSEQFKITALDWIVESADYASFFLAWHATWLMGKLFFFFFVYFSITWFKPGLHYDRCSEGPTDL